MSFKYIKGNLVHTVGNFTRYVPFDGIVDEADIVPIPGGYVVQNIALPADQVELIVSVNVTKANLKLSQFLPKSTTAAATKTPEFELYLARLRERLTSAIREMRKAKAIFDGANILHRFDTAAEFAKATHAVALRAHDSGTCRDISMRMTGLSTGLCLEVYEAPSAKDLKLSFNARP